MSIVKVKSAFNISGKSDEEVELNENKMNLAIEINHKLEKLIPTREQVNNLINYRVQHFTVEQLEKINQAVSEVI